MKYNKLFNKILSKSALLLVATGLIITSTVPNYLYAQEAATESTAEEVNANNESVAIPAENVSTGTAQARGTTQKARGIKMTWTTTSSSCNVTKPSNSKTTKPKTTKPKTTKPKTTKPKTTKPKTTKPETTKPETNKTTKQTKPRNNKT
ncbi:hypothetical protein, partial [Cellulosilyticum ruminicola]|uniref:hypothetical protein n=1 Tax=Cellulosilyticum ruminicola TaxID=425254 RepID=UPI002E8DFB9B